MAELYRCPMSASRFGNQETAFANCTSIVVAQLFRQNSNQPRSARSIEPSPDSNHVQFYRCADFLAATSGFQPYFAHSPKMQNKPVTIQCTDVNSPQEGIPTDTSYDIPNLCQRLLKMQTVDREVINDAVKALERLKSGLKATQATLSNTMQYVEKADQFVAQTAALSIWGHDRNDGTPYEECEAPSEGYADSHECLMNLIEAARDVQEATA